MKRGLSVIGNCRLAATVCFVTILILLTVSYGYSEDVRGVTDDTVKIGLITDLTGPAAPSSGPLAEAVKNYFRHINDQGGINGRKIKLLTEDDRYSIPNAFACFKKLVYKDKIFALMGIAQSGAALALTKHIEREKIPIVTSALAVPLINPPKKHIFIPTPNYEDGMKVGVDYLVRELKPRDARLAIVYPEVEYGKCNRDAAKQRAKLHGLKVVEEEVLNFGALDATSQVMNIRRSKANYVIFAGPPSPQLGAFLKDARRLGFFPETYLASFYTSDVDLIKMVGKAAKNLLGIHCVASWFDERSGIERLRNVTLSYSSNKKPRVRYYVHGWVMSTIMAEGMRRAGKNITNETMIAGLEGLRGFETDGITGPITYGPKNRKPGEYARLERPDLEKGCLVPITGWINPSSH